MFLNAFAASSSSKGNGLLHSYIHLEGLYFCRHDDSAQIDAYYLRAQTLQHSKNYEHSSRYSYNQPIMGKIVWSVKMRWQK